MNVARGALRAPRDNWRLCVAPMMDWTDRHCRYFHRLLAPSARLYTEMLTTGAVLHGDRNWLLGFDPAEHPVALQLGGSEPEALAEAASIGAEAGFDEINLNCGCPSDRVQAGRFGACLMREPALVADCVASMRAAVAVPVTVKCRIGVDDQDEFAALHGFVERVRQSGCEVFIVHARKAWLRGLSPKENRDVPPLDYARVRALKRAFPELTIVLNGGLVTTAAVLEHLAVDDGVVLDGVMLGRAVYHQPWWLHELDSLLFAAGSNRPQDRAELLQRWRPYVTRQLAAGEALAHLTRHLLGLYQGLPGARRFRRVLSERAHLAGSGWEVVVAAQAALGSAQHDE